MLLSIDSIDLSHYSTDELMRLRDRVIKQLPSSTIEDLDLSQELVLRYIAAKDLLDTNADVDTPLNQIAQANNSLVAMLKELAAQQKLLYDTTRAQRLERALAAALRLHPNLEAAFYDTYEAEASALGLENT